MAGKNYIKPRQPRAAYMGKGPGAERGVVVTYVKLMRSNPKYASQLDEIDVEVRQFGIKDFRAKADRSMLGDGIYKDLGAANQAVKTYVARMKKQGWMVLNERKRDTEETKN